MISIIVPTYREEQNIAPLILALNDLPIHKEIIVVDDYGGDNTAVIVKGIAKTNPILKIVERPKKMGLGSAVKDGIAHAEGDIVAVIDADFQHPPSLITNFYNAHLNGADIVLGYRVVNGQHWYRHIISTGAASLARLMIPEARKVKEPLAGFCSMRKELAWFRTDDFKFMLEILHNNPNAKLVEIPYNHPDRRRGKSKLTLTVCYSFIKELLAIVFYEQNRKKEVK